MAIALPREYNFLSRFYRLASVSVLSNMMVPLAGLVDAAFLGHLNDIRHLAGVILASILFDYIYRVLKFIRTSTNAITAQAVGAEDQTATVQALLRSGLIALGISVVILLIQYPLQKAGFFLLSGASEVESSGVEYFYARIWGAPAVLLNFVLFGWFLGREMNGKVLLMSLIGNGANVLLDYLMIIRWGWASSGAGLATALSQYLALVVGLIAVAVTIPWSAVPAAIATVWDRQALKDTVVLKGNIMIRFLVLISTYSIFTNISSTMGTMTLAQNGLLLQIALLSQFTVQGVGMTAQTLIGNFKSKGAIAQLAPVLIVALCTTVPIALSIAAIAILRPDLLFGLLTSHADVNRGLTDYTIWLLPLLETTTIAFMFEGYFIGLKESTLLRNSVLIAFGGGFMPLAATAWYTQNNHLLWFSLVMYMLLLAVVLGSQISRTLNELKEAYQTPMPSL